MGALGIRIQLKSICPACANARTYINAIRYTISIRRIVQMWRTQIAATTTTTTTTNVFVYLGSVYVLAAWNAMCEYMGLRARERKHVQTKFRAKKKWFVVVVAVVAPYLSLEVFYSTNIDTTNSTSLSFISKALIIINVILMFLLLSSFPCTYFVFYRCVRTSPDCKAANTKYGTSSVV